MKMRNLDVLYSYHLDMRIRNFSEISRIIQEFSVDELKKTNNNIEKYILLLRKEYIIEEICRKPNSDLTKSLIGIFGVSPYVLNDLLLQDGINVFLARDAARDFLAARFLQECGMSKADSILTFFSRKNLKVSYRVVKKIINESAPNKKTLSKKIYEKMKDALVTDDGFRKEILDAHRALLESNIYSYKRIRFFDSWASGNIFYVIYFCIRFFENHEYKNNLFIKKIQSGRHDVSFAVANDKTRIRVVKTYHDYRCVEKEYKKWWKAPLFCGDPERSLSDLMKITPFNKYAISTATIKKWYKFYGLELPKDADAADLTEFFSAQIFKKLNHFGSLNLGHPVEWNEAKKCLCKTPAAARMGNILRLILIINSVLGFLQKYKYPVKQSGATRQKNEPRICFLKKEFELDDNKAKILDKMFYINSEHLATAHSSVTKQFIMNAITTLDLLGYQTFANMSDGRNYNFQYYLNWIKNIDSNIYKKRLAMLIDIFTAKKVIFMLFNNVYFFVNEIDNAIKYEANLKRPIDTIILDIDGTITPVEKSITTLKECIMKRIRIVFITGRPQAFCYLMAGKLREIAPKSVANDPDQVIFYSSNGGEAFRWDGSNIKKRESFNKKDISNIENILEKMDFEIVSKRDYRIIATHNKSDINKLLIAKKMIEAAASGDQIGVCFISWPLNGSRKKREGCNAIDICHSNKKIALSHAINNGYAKNYLAIGDDPQNSDRGLLGKNDISVEGFGSTKTLPLIKYIIRKKYAQR